MKRWETELQRFSEAGSAGAGAAGAAGTAGAGATGSGAEAAGTGGNGTDAASQRAESGAKVLYGIQPGAAQGTADAAQGVSQGAVPAEGAAAEKPAAPVNREAEWQKLINGEYRDQFQKQVQGIIDKRFAKTKGLEEQNGGALRTGPGGHRRDQRGDRPGPEVPCGAGGQGGDDR